MNKELEYIKGAIVSDDSDPASQLKVAILGDPGDGKSWLMATGPKPIYVADFDGRKQSLAGKQGLIIKTYVDEDCTHPHAWADFDSDLNNLEYLAKQKTLTIKGIALDSIDYMMAAVDRYVIKDTGLKTSYKINGKFVELTKGFDAFNIKEVMLRDVFQRCFNMGIHVYAVFHVKSEKEEGSTPANPKYTGKYTTEPQWLSKMLPMFNERWFCYIENGKFMVQLKQDYKFSAITALHGVGDVEDANIEAILKKHAEAFAKRVKGAQ